MDATIERMRASGVPLLLEPTDQQWGERVAYVSDPDGNLVMLTRGQLSGIILHSRGVPGLLVRFHREW